MIAEPTRAARSSSQIQALRINRDRLLPDDYTPIPLQPVERADATDRWRAHEYMRSSQARLEGEESRADELSRLGMDSMVVRHV